MNQFAFFMLVGVLSVSAKVYSQEDVISLQMKNASLIDVFNEVTAKTGYDFLYNYDLVKEKGTVDAAFSEVKLKELLGELLAQKNLEYEFRDRVIVVRQATVERQRQQMKKEVMLKGKVTDETGHPMPGVSVYIEHSSIGVATDIHGDYALPFQEGTKQTIVYSFIGMKTVTFNFGGKNTVHNVVLMPDDQMLQDVVVIGYGSKEKRDLTSAISSVKAGELMKSSGGSVNSFDNMLGGAIKGVMVTQNSGQPGAAATVNIRGVTSPLAGSTNEPLYVIDGVPFFNDKGSNMNPLLTIAPGDIESIDVLKDAAATSIYGSRGANGVIIVKTKNGKRNERMTVNLGYTLSVGNPINEYDPLNRDEFLEVQNLILNNAVTALNQGNYIDESSLRKWGKVSDTPDGLLQANGLNESMYGNANTDWVKEIKNKNALTHQYNVAIRGGSEKTNYSFSFNATDQEGLYINDKLERYGARLSVDTDISKRFKGGASLNYSYSRYKSGGESTIRPWIMRPDMPVYDESGHYARWEESENNYAGTIIANPVAVRKAIHNDSKSYQFIGSSYLEYEVVKNLKLHGDINISFFQEKANNFSGKEGLDDLSNSDANSPYLSTLSVSDAQTANSSVNFRADYQWSNEDHQFNAMAGYGWDRLFTESFGSDYQGFPDDKVLNDVQSAYESTSKRSSKGNSGLNSFYARVGYIYGDRYLAEVNFRSDASSKFGPGNKRGYFPSVSLGWRMNKENFLSQYGWMDNLKLRFSWGKTGSTNIDDFAYRQFFVRGDNNVWNGKPSITLGSRLPNRNVKWEMTTEYNGGLEFAFWSNRLYGSIDAYYRKTDGALGSAPSPLETGFGSYYANVIDMSNKGMEVEVGGDIIRNADWKWSSRFNISFNRNKLEKLNGVNIDPVYMDNYAEGHPVGIVKGYAVEKIFQAGNEAEIAALDQGAVEKGAYGYSFGATLAPGDYKFKDVDGSGYIDEKDKVIIGNPEPKYFGGFFNSVSWKNLNLSFMFQFSKGVKAVASTIENSGLASFGNSTHRELWHNTWTPENPDARYARLLYQDVNMNYGMGGFYEQVDRYVYDASYLRLKNITLSYNLPATVLQRLNIQSVQVFASISNIWTLTDWPGIDPEEVGVSGSVRSGSTSNDPYPLSKTFSLGVNIQF